MDKPKPKPDVPAEAAPTTPTNKDRLRALEARLKKKGAKQAGRRWWSEKKLP